MSGRADPPEQTVLGLIKELQAGRAAGRSGATLSVHDRRRVVEHLWADGYSVPEIAEVVGMPERTIQRDRQAIRQANALEVHDGLVPEVVGGLVRQAEVVIARLRRVSRDRETPAAAKVAAELGCWQVGKELVESLQTLGYLPRAPHELRAAVSVDERRGARLAVAAPRGHAKSTLMSMAYVLWCLCYRRESYIVLLSNTADQACDLLSHIKRELEGNERLRADFPGVCEDAGSRPGPPRWRKDEVITRSDAKVTALGAGSKIRGRKHRQHRPTLVILDDVENEADVRSPEQREQLEAWFHHAVANAGTAASIVVLNVRRRVCLACRYGDSGGGSWLAHALCEVPRYNSRACGGSSS